MFWLIILVTEKNKKKEKYTCNLWVAKDCESVQTQNVL